MRPFLAGLLCLIWAGSLSLFADEITPAHCALAAQFSRSHGGVALLVQQGGKVIYEDYAPGFSASTPHKIYSGTKCFVAVTALIAMRQGLLTLNERASDTLTEWRGDRRRAITIDQLLSQTSGLDPDDAPFDSARDQFAAAVRVHPISPPGSRFHYGAAGYQAFGEILRRKLRPLNRTVEGYMRDKLFDPLGIDIAAWTHDDAGNPLLHAGLSLSAREWARFGEFIDQGGAEGRRQIVPKQLLSLLLVGHRANPAYGLGFWLNRPPPVPRLQSLVELQPAIDGNQLDPGGPKDLVAAIGTSRQRLYMVPSLDLVVVRFGTPSAFSDGDFLSRLLTGRPHPDAHTH